jgi:hypothetical protein
MIFFSKFTNVKFIRSEVCISKERTHLLSPLHNHGDTVSFYLTKTLRGRANQILSIKWSIILYMQVHKKQKWCNVKARICVQNKNSNRYKYIGGATVFNISLTRLQDSLINQDETQWDLGQKWKNNIWYHFTYISKYLLHFRLKENQHSLYYPIWEHVLQRGLSVFSI